MQLFKLSEDQLRNSATTLIIQRAENYIGKFNNCKIEGPVLKGTIKGNHGIYNVELKIDTDPIQYKCDCDTAKTSFCKHAAALGLTYIYTPWVFELDHIPDRTKISSFEELQYYVKTVKLKDLLEDLRGCCITVAQLSELLGISAQQLLAIVKDDQSNKHHILTDPIKLSCMYLLEKRLQFK
ncbi:SWIM zinc finger family protein [Calditerrivibrio nitroreducens]|uniref:SWIM-type domain-containing protein n=1 Tax=Calditerrivibrio nitroreducens (strain DSM 19672 / NBRC 101217 / Yu37-1) TaxID=768670 RepID=E4THY6_CALNY|nr:hypothetical protein [Calditerrivibrio nitroreducens]ADR18916.1 hypothetical protein Calni_1005 [Calditerrivibrio nitroreducens DSM 19672]